MQMPSSKDFVTPAVLSVRPGGYSLANRRLYSCIFQWLEEKRSGGPFYHLWKVLAKERHLLQILLKALPLCLGLGVQDEILQVVYLPISSMICLKTEICFWSFFFHCLVMIAVSGLSIIFSLVISISDPTINIKKYMMNLGAKNSFQHVNFDGSL